MNLGRMAIGVTWMITNKDLPPKKTPTDFDKISEFWKKSGQSLAELKDLTFQTRGELKDAHLDAKDPAGPIELAEFLTEQELGTAEADYLGDTENYLQVEEELRKHKQQIERTIRLANKLDVSFTNYNILLLRHHRSVA